MHTNSLKRGLKDLLRAQHVGSKDRRRPALRRS